MKAYFHTWYKYAFTHRFFSVYALSSTAQKDGEDYMSFKFRMPAILSILLLSSVIGFAASPSQENTGLQPQSIKNLVIFGSLGVKFLSPETD